MGFMASMSPRLLDIGYKLLLGFVILIALSILFFAQKYFIVWYKRRKSFKILATSYNPDGSFFVDKIGKFKTEDGIDKMLFLSSKESFPVIDPKYIKANTVTLWRYGIGQYAVINPSHWIGLDPKKFKIEPVNMQMKNFAYLEQRAAVSRWAYLKDILSKYGPYITFVVLGIVTGVVAWFMLKTGLTMMNDIMITRMAECRQILGMGQAVAPTV